MIAYLVIIALAVFCITLLLGLRSILLTSASQIASQKDKISRLTSVILDKNSTLAALRRKNSEQDYLITKLQQDLDVSNLHANNFRSQIDLLTKTVEASSRRFSSHLSLVTTTPRHHVTTSPRQNATTI